MSCLGSERIQLLDLSATAEAAAFGSEVSWKVAPSQEMWGKVGQLSKKKTATSTDYSH